MCRRLFIDLNLGRRHAREVFVSPMFEYVTNIQDKKSNDYNLVVIHAHGSCCDGTLHLHNYGKGDEDIFDKSKYIKYNIQDISKMLSELQGKYILFLLACNSFSEDIGILLNDNCIAIIAPEREIFEDDSNERMEELKYNLLVELNRDQVDKIQELVTRYNEYIDSKDLYRVIEK